MKFIIFNIPYYQQATITYLLNKSDEFDELFVTMNEIKLK